MRKILFILMALFTAVWCPAQDKLSTRNGKVSFFSKATLSNIEAHNNTAVSVFEKTSGNIEFAVLMKGFEFEKSLMQEHFNDDYVESDKFPKSVFKGNMSNIKDIDFSKDGTYTATVTGNLTIHGITKSITVPAQLVVTNASLQASSEFSIVLSDYGIKIPSMVSGDISNSIRIKANFKYALK